MAQITSCQNPPPGSAKSTLEQRRARREQFRNFYGLKNDATAKTEGVNDSKLVGIGKWQSFQMSIKLTLKQILPHLSLLPTMKIW